MLITRCSRCVLPETYPGIRYDAQGVCNYCHSHRVRPLLGEQALQQRVEAQKKKSGPYDSMVALSGGRDSTYVAYYAHKVLGLRPLLYSYDNGMMPEHTAGNIARTARRLGLDHVFVQSDRVAKNARYVLNCWIHHPSAAMIGLLCSGCRTGYIQGLHQTARAHGIPLVLTGGGEPERSFARRLLSSTGSRTSKRSLVTGMLQQGVQNPHYLAHPIAFARLGEEFFYRYYRTRRKIGLTVPIFRYIPWDEETIVSTIEQELGWQGAAYTKATWRSDCMLNELKNYLYKSTLGFTKNDELLSGMIRTNRIGRAEALERLDEDNQISPQFIADLCADLGADYQALERALGRTALPTAAAA